MQLLCIELSSKFLYDFMLVCAKMSLVPTSPSFPLLCSFFSLFRIPILHQKQFSNLSLIINDFYSFQCKVGLNKLLYKATFLAVNKLTIVFLIIILIPRRTRPLSLTVMLNDATDGQAGLVYIKMWSDMKSLKVCW